MIAPRSGRKTIAWYISAFHHVDVLDRDRAAIAVEGNHDGEPDRRLGGGNGEHDQRIDLPDEIAEERGEGDEVEIDGEQDQLDRHQDDDDVLAVDEDAENAEREQNRGHGQIMGQSDDHVRPLPGSTLRISMMAARATCTAIDWRLTPTLWRSVSTIAPIMATSRM